MSWLTPPQDRELPRTWSESDRFLPRVFVRPAQQFLRTESAGAAIMLLAALVALVWVNSPLGSSYASFWEAPVDLTIGSFDELSGLTVRGWVNEGAMALFFLLVALEIKRELVTGDFRDRRAATLPIIAALGGMAAPAAIYLAFNAGTAAAHGWGVPTATDIAFAAAVITLAGPRVPSGAKLLLLAIAIADDIGAIVIIAAFYSRDIAWWWLAAAVSTLPVAVALGRAHVRATSVFVVLGTVCWFCLHQAGVHPTLAGVAFGLLTPAWSFVDPATFGRHARPLVDEIEEATSQPRLAVWQYEHVQSALRDLARLTKETSAPLYRLVTFLSPLVSFLVLPVFALANAGIPISGAAVSGWWRDPVLLGVGLGLVIGKLVGIFLTVFVTCRLTIIRLPQGVRWGHVLGVAACGGVGFTVSLFIAELSSTDPEVVESLKLGVLVGSVVAGIIGLVILRATTRGQADVQTAPTPDALRSVPDRFVADAGGVGRPSSEAAS